MYASQERMLGVTWPTSDGNEVAVYHESALRKIAREAIAEEAKIANVKARYISFSVIVGRDACTLEATGERRDGYRFTVNIAI